MAHKGQWSRVQLAGIGRQLQQEVYDDVFPVEARHYFSDWIEDQNWEHVNPEDLSDVATARGLFTAFLTLVGERARQCDEKGEFMASLQLEKIHKSMLTRYGERPLDFIRAVQHGLTREQNLLKANESDSSPVAAMDNRRTAIELALQQLSTALEEMKQDVRVLEGKQESIVAQSQELYKIRLSVKNMTEAMKAQGLGNRAVPQQQLTAVRNHESQTDKQLYNDVNVHINARKLVYRKGAELLQLCSNALVSILEELDEWKFAQYMARGGLAPPGPLDTIQSWFESLADILWGCRRQVRQLQHQKSQVPVVPDEDPELTELDQTSRRLLSQLMQKSFIVERQPLQVVRTQTRFGASVRMLAGCKLSLHIEHIEVQAHILPIQQARPMVVEPNFVQLASFRNDIRNPIKVMEYNTSSQVFGADFTAMILPRRPRRGGSASDSSVAEEKFCLVFSAKCCLGNDIEIPVMAISCPLVVIVHATQSVASEATMFWDSAFSDPATLIHKESVEWGELANAIHLYFQKTCERGLDEAQLRCLYSRAYPRQEYDEKAMFPLCRLHRENLEGCRFTFWSWIHSAADLIKKQAIGMWAKGLIAGFLSRNQAEEMLSLFPAQDTFLIRFSQTVEGTLTVTYSEMVEDAARRSLDHLAPWTLHDLSVLGLANRVRDLDCLKVLYPNTPKSGAFFSFYTASNPTPDNSYTRISMHIQREKRTSTSNPATPGNSTGQLDSNPSTPGSGTDPSLSPAAPLPQQTSPSTLGQYPMVGNENSLSPSAILQLSQPIPGMFDDPSATLLPQLSHQSIQNSWPTSSLLNGGTFPPLGELVQGGGIEDIVDRWSNM